MPEAPPRLPEPRDEVAALMRRIYRCGLTTTSGGNASVRDGDGRIWITPAALDKGELRPTDVVCVGPDGSLVGGEPSSELPLHREVYRERSDVGAIVHAHPWALVAFSLRHEAPKTAVLPPAAEVCGRVGYVAYELTGSDRLGRRVAEAFAKGSDCVILENHGVVAAGCDCREAFVRLETLEWTAAIIAAAASLGAISHPTTRAGLDHAERPRSAMPPDAPPDAPPDDSPAATPQETTPRQEVCRFVRRGYQRHLISSSQGVFSARIDEGSFVITSPGADRETIAPDDLLRVGRGSAGAFSLHQAIYAAHPGFNAVIEAAPIGATAFSVTGTPMESRTIPESFLLLREVGNVPYDLARTDPERVAAIVGPDQPTALLQNRGVLVVGRSLLEAFDRLEVLEANAQSVIWARRLGGFTALSDEAVEELREVFLRPRDRLGPR